jgi:hypothetical protein
MPEAGLCDLPVTMTTAAAPAQFGNSSLGAKGKATALLFFVIVLCCTGV